MLEDLEREGNDSIVSWAPCGTSFRIHKPKEFAEKIMPRYFNQTKYRSFQRQLHIYDFDRIKDKNSSPGGGAYYHKFFVKGNSGLCLKMSRQKIKGTGTKARKVMHSKHEQASSKDSIPSTKPNDTKFNKVTKRSRRSSLAGILQEIESCTPLPVSSKEIDTLDWANMAESVVSSIPVSSSVCGEMKIQSRSPYRRSTRNSGLAWNHFQDGDESFFAGKKFFLTTAYVAPGGK